jgi:thiol-disulfide isomerase/thioredoxin
MTSQTFNRGRRRLILAAAALPLLTPSAAVAQPTLLEDLAGNPAKLETYIGAGKWSLVLIWATTCHVCEQEIPGIQAYYQGNKPDDLAILGVSLDGPALRPAVQSYIDERHLTYPNLIAHPVPFAAEFHSAVGEPLRGTPTFLLFDPDGKLAAANVGRLNLDALDSYLQKKRKERAAT